MNEHDVKEVMDQIHISPKMQEEIIKNIQKRMDNGRNDTRPLNWKKTAVTAAAVVSVVCVASIPVLAMVDFVKERMESIPKEELLEINNMVQAKPTEADVFSREYSDTETERKKELWQAYKGGRFPENTLAQVDNAEDAQRGTLCYIRSTGVFNLPDREMTDEEILEIIDFQRRMSYAVSQGPAAQEAKAEMEEKERRLQEMIQAARGINEDEAIEIARKQMEAELGEDAEGKEILRYNDGSVAVILLDISEETKYDHQGNVAYLVIFNNPADDSTYHCVVDSVGGNVLKTY